MNEALEVLLSDGVIDEVVGRLKSGKEADVYLVGHGGQVVAAKIYKERQQRSFRNNADYKEGRQVRNSRTARAIAKGSRFGQAAAEDAWKTAEADALYKLHAAGVRVPTPVLYYEGVLLMELVRDAEGQPAPRLMDAMLSPESAAEMYRDLRNQATMMLCNDVIHGDLSPYNILLGERGPTLIDFPQTLNAAASSRAEYFFKRDVENLLRFFAGMDPNLGSRLGDAHEIWRAYTKRELTPDFEPSGRGLSPEERRAMGAPRVRPEPVPVQEAPPEEDEFALLRQGGGARPRIADLARAQAGHSRGGQRHGRGGAGGAPPRGPRKGPPSSAPKEPRAPRPQEARPQAGPRPAGMRPNGGGRPQEARPQVDARPQDARQSGGARPQDAHPRGRQRSHEARPQGVLQESQRPPDTRSSRGARPAEGAHPQVSARPAGMPPQGGAKPESAHPHGGAKPEVARPHGGAKPESAHPHGGARLEGAHPHGGARPEGARPHGGVRSEGGRPHGGARPEEAHPHGGARRESARPHGGARPEGARPQQAAPRVQTSAGVRAEGARSQQGAPRVHTSAGARPEGARPHEGARPEGARPQQGATRAQASAGSGGHGTRPQGQGLRQGGGPSPRHGRGFTSPVVTYVPKPAPSESKDFSHPLTDGQGKDAGHPGPRHPPPGDRPQRRRRRG